MIGFFGSAVFSVSDSHIYTLRDVSRTVAPRLGTHDLINRKPATEFVGEGLESLSFTISLHVNMGLSVRGELERWARMAEIGEVNYLVLDGRPVGSNRWVISSVSQAYGVIASGGGLVSAQLDVSLQEYT